MQNYKDLDYDSNVQAYELGDDYILVKFKDGSTYAYTNASAGSSAIGQMKKLAVAGDGLNAFIGSHKPRYSSKQR